MRRYFFTICESYQSGDLFVLLLNRYLFFFVTVRHYASISHGRDVYPLFSQLYWLLTTFFSYLFYLFFLFLHYLFFFFLLFLFFFFLLYIFLFFLLYLCFSFLLYLFLFFLLYLFFAFLLYIFFLFLLYLFFFFLLYLFSLFLLYPCYFPSVSCISLRMKLFPRLRFLNAIPPNSRRRKTCPTCPS